MSELVELKLGKNIQDKLKYNNQQIAAYIKNPNEQIML
jgi:hypothetical protein